jgi:hypothetical protein
MTTLTDKIRGVETSTAIKAPCRLATTGNITLSGLQSIDGVTTAEGDRVLVWQQSDPEDNGIYAASSGLWERSVDMDGQRDVRSGTLVMVAVGTLYGGRLFQLVTVDPITIGTTEMVFSVISGFVAGSIETITEDDYEITSDDNGKILRWAGGVGEDAIWELPDDLSAGFCVFILRSGDGELKTTVLGGATRTCRLDTPGNLHNGIDLPKGLGYLIVEANTDGSSAEWLFGGATAVVA